MMIAACTYSNRYSPRSLRYPQRSNTQAVPITTPTLPGMYLPSAGRDIMAKERASPGGRSASIRWYRADCRARPATSTANAAVVTHGSGRTS